FFQKELKDSAGNFVMIFQNNFSNGLYFFAFYQGLEINFINLPFQRVKVNLFKQYIHRLTVYIQHYLASSPVDLQQPVYCGFLKFNRDRAFNLFTKYITGNVSLSS